MDSGPHYPPKYVMLNDQGNLRPPPHRRHIPRYHSHHHGSGGNCCLKCICCCYCFLFILILVLFGTAFFLLTVYKPQKPSYNVSQVVVKAFNIQTDLSLYTEFSVSVKADNPNDYIGFIYGKESSVAVLYTGTTLCSGKLPAFHQPGNNITLMNILLKGKNEFGSGLQETLLQNQKEGKIPLLITVKTPVNIVIAGFPLRQVLVFVNCSLVVDSLSPNDTIGILSIKLSQNLYASKKQIYRVTDVDIFVP
ncbi:NDR1/HIN1-like protein 6 [Durio zibethinus]|uniref:NDR1/HIN1-like protein 6 n=1 Tax=Durio zibethinus TaxID=66656 RepID=A0A6P5X9H7_DURZI|nr:NDR1/HIN1-like protein 6 [Durio zibethinus]